MKHLEPAFDWLPGCADRAFLKAFICDVSPQPLWTLSLEMVHFPDVESPNPNPSISTDESQPHTQWGCRLIEFPWSQWTHSQDLQVPVLAFDKQMTPMELRSQPAKTRARERKIKSRTQTSPISTHPGLSPMLFTLCVLSPWCLRRRFIQRSPTTHTHTHAESDVCTLVFCHSVTSFPLLSVTVWVEGL